MFNVTVDFTDQLHGVTRPVASFQEAVALVNNEASFDNTVQAYAWASDGSGHIVYCQHGQGSPLYRPQAINIDTLVEDYRI